MEPLAVLNFAPKPPVFLARADIFAKPLVRAILTFLKILPVYRIRDGQSNLGKNSEIFDRSRDVLLDGFPLCLMAEGRHNDRHHLLPMGKGMFRIAGETQLMLGEHPLYIVPTGIDFDEYERPYSNLVVNIGKPIPVQPYMNDFRENEPVALNAMRADLAKALSPLMHDIRNEEYYDEIYTLCNILNPTIRQRDALADTAWNRFNTRRSISLRLDDAAAKSDDSGSFHKLMETTRNYQALCRKLKIRESVPASHWSLTATLLASTAVAALLAAFVALPPVRWCVLFLLLCYPIMLLPTNLITRRLIADSQFRSSVNFGIRFFFSIIYTIIISIVIACCNGLWMSRLADIGPWWGLVAVALAHVEAVCAPTIVNAFKALGNNIRLWWLRLTRKATTTQLDNSLKAAIDGYNAL
jgi:hypothetical protein